MQELRPLKSKSWSLPVRGNLQRTQPVFGIQVGKRTSNPLPFSQEEQGNGWRGLCHPSTGGLRSKAELCVMKSCPNAKANTEHLY